GRPTLGAGGGDAVRPPAAPPGGGPHRHAPVTLVGPLAAPPAAGDALVVGMGVKRNHRGHGLLPPWAPASLTLTPTLPDRPDIGPSLHGASALCKVVCRSNGRTSGVR